MTRLSCVVLLLLGLQSPAFAQAAKPQPQPPEILAQQQALRGALKSADPRYVGVTPFRRNRIYQAQDQVFALAQGHQRLDELGADDQLRLFNALELIGSYLGKRNEDARMVCERTAIAGTRRQQLACMEQDERERRADRAVDTLMTRPACTQPGCI